MVEQGDIRYEWMEDNDIPVKQYNQYLTNWELTVLFNEFHSLHREVIYE